MLRPKFWCNFKTNCATVPKKNGYMLSAAQSRHLLLKIYRVYKRFLKTSMEKWKIFRMPEFKLLLQQISGGAVISADELLPYLAQENLQSRQLINLKLAEAYCESGNYQQAKVHIRRVMTFSGLDEEFLLPFTRIHAACGDILAIRETYKALGMRAAAQGNIVKALDHFNAWQYAYATHSDADEYHYDFEVLEQIALLAKPHLFPARQRSHVKGRKIRLAYLMFGMSHVNSVIVKISMTFAKYHDAAMFDLCFFVPEQKPPSGGDKVWLEDIKRIEDLGWNVVTAPSLVSEAENLIEIGRAIYDYVPDILVTNAGLADFKHYFIASLRPAPLTVGLCQGPPPQFIAPDFDWSISWTKHPLLDCPTNCSVVPLGFEISERKHSRVDAKSSYGLPVKSLVLMICGRRSKLLNADLWKSIVNLLLEHSGLHFVVVGLGGELPYQLSELISADIISRVRVLGWEKDFLKVLSMADVVIDTYPSGGGVTIIDAMAFGTPVVSFRNNYMQIFTQTDWSPAEEFMGMSELLVERGNFEELSTLISKLLTDTAYHEELSHRCRERIVETMGNPEGMIRECESVYKRLLS